MENELAELIIGEFQDWKKNIIIQSKGFINQILQLNGDDIDINKLMPIVDETFNRVITLDHHKMFTQHLINHYVDNLSKEQIKSLYEFCIQNPWYAKFSKLNADNSDEVLMFNQFIAEEMQKSLEDSGILN